MCVSYLLFKSAYYVIDYFLDFQSYQQMASPEFKRVAYYAITVQFFDFFETMLMTDIELVSAWEGKEWIDFMRLFKSEVKETGQIEVVEQNRT